MHRIVLLLLSALVLTQAGPASNEDEYHHKFSGWMNKHNKAYTSTDYHKKFSKFKRNHDFVEHHNSQKRSYEVGLNELADMSNEEYREVYLGLKGEFAEQKTATATLMLGDPVDPVHEKRGETKAKASQKTRYTTTSPNSVDWQAAGAVTSVKNQAQCGCCWAFAATAAIEGMAKIVSGKLVDLSPQNLLDCTTGSSCSGGYIYDAINYTIGNMGVAKAALYPSYTMAKQACRYASTMKGTAVNSVVSMLPGSEDGLLTQIAVQPIAIVIDASQPSFQFYKSGIYSEPACSKTSFNHAVLLVGYDTNSTGTPFWRLKNQWGTSWGMQGYMQIARGSNMCNMAAQSTYPSMAVPQPTFYVYGDSLQNSWAASYSPLASGFSAMSNTFTYVKGAYAVAVNLSPGGSITFTLPVGSLGYKTLHYWIRSNIAAQFKITLVAGKGVTWTMTQSTWAGTWVQSAMATRPNTSFSQITIANIASSVVSVSLDEIYFTTS